MQYYFRHILSGALFCFLTSAVATSLTMATVQPAAAKPKKAKPPIKAPPNFEPLFEAQQPAIRDCALENGINKGATSVDLKAKILISRDGRVFGAEVTAKLEGQGDRPAVEACVSKVLQGMMFPPAGGTFRQLLRNWRFAMTP